MNTRTPLLIFSALSCLWLGSGCVPQPKDPIHELERRGITYTEQNFVLSIQKGDAQAVRFFLDAGMDPNTRTEAGMPMLLLAASNGHSRILELLLAKGSFVNITDKEGQTALMIAGRRNDAESIKALLEYKADAEMRLPPSGQTALLLATAQGELRAVETLAKGGAKLDARDNEGRTALFLALDNVPVFQLLVKLGADVNARYKGVPILTYAKETGNILLIRTLRSAGAREPQIQQSTW